jgi:NADH dehydrogenase [ubiquinone] 1 alpha subcomplex assembly factor 5
MVNTNIEIFNPADVRRFKSRALKNFQPYNFLYDWAAHQTLERLKDIKREHIKILHIGNRHADFYKTAFPALEIFQDGPEQDIGLLPIENASYDLILSTLDLHTINDLPGALAQIRNGLKPDGLFLASLFGGETLFELRASLTHAEMTTKGGASPRVFPFADKQQLGALLQRAGFALPVIDSEIITVTYENIFKLMHDLRGMGESNSIAARSRKNPGRAFFMEAAQHYQQKFSEGDGRICASFEIIFLLGWAPHASQPKALKPGSATNRLADALMTTEIKTPDA